MKTAHNFLWDFTVGRERNPDNVWNAYRSFLMDTHKWLTEHTVRQLYRQSCYYAWKDGVIPSIFRPPTMSLLERVQRWFK